MRIIVGLGNIGEKYLRTRHNCGFIFMDVLTIKIEQEEGIKIEWKEDSKMRAYTAKVPYGDQILYLVKPTTLMNNSGECVSKIMSFFKEPLSNLTIVYDDIDLPLGKIRVREKGGPGTHNGMRSLVQLLGSEEFPRIRIGIESRGDKTPEQQDISSYVLSNFLESEIPELKEAMDKAIDELKKQISS